MSRSATVCFAVVLAALLGASRGVAQPVRDAPGLRDRAPVVSGIAILGNKTTKSEIILREMTLHAGDSVTTDALQYCQERVYSLGLFNRVTISCPPMDSTILFVEVDERWYLYPVPLLGTVERDIRHWYYGLGVKHENFRGWNEKIFAGFVLGYNPWVSLYYGNPWIFGSEQLFTETSLGYQNSINKSLVSKGEGPDFHELRYSAAQTLGKRFDAFRTAVLEMGFSYVEVSEKREGRTAAKDGIDRFAWVGIGARHDTRNLREYPTAGMFGSASARKKGLGFGEVDFVQGSIDTRIYTPVTTRLSLGVRAFATLRSGPSIPNYEHVFFGYSERIRGHFGEELEGDNQAGASAELRFALVPPFYLQVQGMPVREFATWKLALYAAAFVDAGQVWDRHQRPDWRHSPRGAGVGLHFLFPYSAVLRVDRAWNERGVGEWIIDIGTAF
ncbi:MAG: BamA/TamA family outer membrane protein [Ignavibacteria bacterium]|nr:BamA/TamA family outer membrane protein [Ignavibacteria bacterium]